MEPEAAYQLDFGQDERRILAMLAKVGFVPRVIFDIGAAVGGWSEMMTNVCSNAEYHLFEPLGDTLPLYRDGLADRVKRYPNFTAHSVALGDRNGTTMMSVADDGYSSSVIDMSGVPGFGVTVPIAQHRLDDYVEAHGLPQPDLVKIDTQATEDLVVAGGERTLVHARILIIESWFSRGYGPRTPLLTELAALLRPADFQLCNLGQQYFSDSHELYAVDAVFAKRAFLDRYAAELPKGRW